MYFSTSLDAAKGIEVVHEIYPSTERPVLFEHFTVRNVGQSPVRLEIARLHDEIVTDPAKGVQGAYVLASDTDKAGIYKLEGGRQVTFNLVMQGYVKDFGPLTGLDPAAELRSRMALVDGLGKNLILETPSDVINTEFEFAKLRGCESIIATKGGLMHAPGGGAYYAAIWANDQAEYINPFFPFTGYATGVESAYNSYRHFARFMNDNYDPIPSSIIAEGIDFWNGAGDRGDAAMIAYGASRFALETGNAATARDLWPLIEWCLEYCRRNLNDAGVVASDSDELEGRFPSGSANLCTSTLYYDALYSAAYLALGLGMDKSVAELYRAQAAALRDNIERYFGGEVMGYDTYRYYEGNDVLRSWICMPLVMGIFDRAGQTLQALFGSGLYTKDGLLTAYGDITYWDRSTLYAFRGAYNAGYADFITPELLAYSHRRLLEDHVPYPIESAPEGNQRHLSAESGLYCRIITEGLFGIRPTGLKTFSMKPEMPSEWDHIALRHVRAFDSDFDIEVVRSGKKLRTVVSDRTTGRRQLFKSRQGEYINVTLK